MTLFDVANSLLGAIVLIRAISFANSMDAKTKHCMRAAVTILSVSALGLILAPLYAKAHDWLMTLFVLGVAIYFLGEKRRGRPPKTQVPELG